MHKRRKNIPVFLKREGRGFAIQFFKMPVAGTRLFSFFHFLNIVRRALVNEII